jgi:aminoglycoside phosphotransferase (APT) family kinase protein
VPELSPPPVSPEPGPAPPDAALRWAAAVAGGGPARLLRPLNDHGSPWLLQAGPRQVVLRTGQPAEADMFATEAAGLAVAAAAGFPVPRLLGHDGGTAAGRPVLLVTCVPGRSAIPATASPARLAALGAVTARLHTLPRMPGRRLPRRICPIGAIGQAALQGGDGAGPLRRGAAARLRRVRPASDRTVFVHGDLWQGNVLWDGDELTGVVDWDCAGAGPPGVDLGSLRMDAAFCYGQAAAGDVLAAYERAAGAPAADVAYYDVVAALATPPELGWFPPVMAAQGRPDLTREVLVRRHETFLAAALDRLA